MLNKAQAIGRKLGQYNALLERKAELTKGGSLTEAQSNEIAQIHYELSGIRFTIEDVQALMEHITTQEIRIAKLVDEVAKLHDRLYA